MSALLRGVCLAGAVGCLALLIVVNMSGLGAQGADVRSLLVAEVFGPRLAAALLCGAALGLSAAVFQQALQNPLAAPETLGVNAGAQLFLTATLLWAPAVHARHPNLIALIGAFAAWGLIALIVRRRSDPTAVALVGLIVSFVLGTLATLLTIFHQEYVTSMLIWGAGALAQDGWDRAIALFPHLALGVAAIALLARPLGLFGLGERSAAALGVRLGVTRALAIAAAVTLAAGAAATVGAVAFVGLAAPHLSRLMGVRRLPPLLVCAPVAGALLLALVDQAVLLLPQGEASDVPTGAVTALVGAPLLIWLLRRMPDLSFSTVRSDAPPTPAQKDTTGGLLWAIGAGAMLIVLVGLVVGRGPEGFALDLCFGDAFDWRLPRTVAAAGAGIALGASGALIQRLYGNPMASPEVLGIGAGVGAALVVALMLNADPDPAYRLTAAVIGAGSVCVALTALGGRLASPQRLLLVGVSLTALLNGATLLFLATGDPRVGQVVAWLGGSTYGVDLTLAACAAVVAGVGVGVSLALGRMLDALAVGDETARSVGLRVTPARILILSTAAVLAAAASIVIGPMSFAGLLAPRLASMVGFRRWSAHVLGAASIGGLLLISSDWIGRIVFAPTELPAGLVAILLGAAVVLIAELRRSRVAL